MLYCIEVHLLARYIQWTKIHGETVKYVSVIEQERECPI
jgi:hypothetical protein